MKMLIAGLLMFGMVFSVHAELKIAPDFSLKSPEGKEISLSDYKGKVVLVNFWGTGCPPCRAEIPDFVKVYNELKDKGFVIIGIEVQSPPAALEQFIKKYKITYPVAVGRGNRDIASAYGGVRFIPTTFLIDRKGNIVKKHVGIMKESELKKLVESLCE